MEQATATVHILTLSQGHNRKHTGRQTVRQIDRRTDEYGCPRRTEVGVSVGRQTALLSCGGGNLKESFAQQPASELIELVSHRKCTERRCARTDNAA